jgi:hypothetical protein
VEKIFQANCTSKSLKAVQAQAEQEVNRDFILNNRVLIYDDWVVVPADGNLQIMLIKKAHVQISTAHSSWDKIY